MNSSWLLFKTQRRSLLICGGLCFLASFLLVYADIRPSDLDKAAMIAGLSLIFALLLVFISRFHTRLYTLPFPVTYRQLAWVPALCMAVLWAAGLAGIFTGIGVLSIVGGPACALPQWTPFLLAILSRVPLSFLLFALIDRIARYLGVSALAFVAWPTIFINVRDQLEGLEYALAFYHYGWPLCIVLGVFFVLEAPAHIAAMDYPAFVKQGLIGVNIRPPGGQSRVPAIKIFGDLLTALICMLAVIWFFASMGPLSDLDSVTMLLRVYLVGIVVAVLFGVRAAWRNTQANGFSAEKTLAVFLMQCSLVLLPITWVLGAKRGIVATCNQCRQYKFLWAPHCPHCGHANQGTIVRVSPLHFWKKDRGAPLWRKQVSSRMLYRVVLPFYLACFSLMSLSEVHFRSETITLTPTQQGVDTVLPEIREYLASVKDARGWLDAHGDAALLIPEQFRIEARMTTAWVTPPLSSTPLEVEVIQVECYLLRWEKVGEVGKRVKTRILEAFPDAQFTVSDSANENDHARARVNRAALPSYLDGRIHWITR